MKIVFCVACAVVETASFVMPWRCFQESVFVPYVIGQASKADEGDLILNLGCALCPLRQSFRVRCSVHDRVTKTGLVRHQRAFAISAICPDCDAGLVASKEEVVAVVYSSGESQ